MPTQSKKNLEVAKNHLKKSTILKMEKFLIMELMTLKLCKKQKLIILELQHKHQMTLSKSLKRLLLDLLTTKEKYLRKTYQLIKGINYF